MGLLPRADGVSGTDARDKEDTPRHPSVAIISQGEGPLGAENEWAAARG